MTEEERQEAVNELKEICQEIGCSGMSSECLTYPHQCKIIKKLILKSFTSDLVKNMEDIGSEFSKVVDEHIWDLI